MAIIVNVTAAAGLVRAASKAHRPEMIPFLRTGTCHSSVVAAKALTHKLEEIMLFITFDVNECMPALTS